MDKKKIYEKTEPSEAWRLFEAWYDSRKSALPPAAQESWNAGWNAAIEKSKKGD